MATKAPEKEVKVEKILSQESRNKVPFSVVEAYKNLRMHVIALLEKDNSKFVAISSAGIPYAIYSETFSTSIS